MSTKNISLTIRNQDPTASFEYFSMEPPTGDIVSFSAEASDFDRPNGDLEYEWTFGDGSSGFGPTPQNEYDDEGSYDVTLTVTDEYGASATATRMVTVSNRAPTARIAYGPRAPLTDETVVRRFEKQRPRRRSSHLRVGVRRRQHHHDLPADDGSRLRRRRSLRRDAHDYRRGRRSEQHDRDDRGIESTPSGRD